MRRGRLSADEPPFRPGASPARLFRYRPRRSRVALNQRISGIPVPSMEYSQLNVLYYGRPDDEADRFPGK